MTRVAGLVLALAGGAARLAGQATIAEVAYTGPGSGEFFGLSFAGVGDIDGDGHDDFVTSAFTGGAEGHGIVQILSGADFAVIREWVGDPSHDSLGFRVDSAGDVDGDGVQDVVIGAALADAAGLDAGLVQVRSSASGALLYEVHGLQAADEFGGQVAGVGDLDGDGHAEFAGAAIAAESPSGDPFAGYVRIFSGADGHEFVKLQGQEAFDQVGIRVRPVGDFDADGTPDVLVSGGFLQSHIWVYSGAWIVAGTAPAVLLYYTADATGSSPEAVDAAGDFDRDGWADVLIGFSTPGTEFAGYRVISGQDHSLLYEHVGSLPGFQTLKVAGGSDLDRDGFPDVLIQESKQLGPPWPGMVEGFSGQDGSILYTCLPLLEDSNWNRHLAIIGDVNADGYVDWGIGDGHGIPGDITLFTGAGLWIDLGQGLAGSTGVPELSGAGPLLGADPVDVTLAGAPPSQPFVLVMGLSAVNHPFHGGVFVPDAGLLLFDLADTAGGRQWSGTWPQHPAAQSLYFQAWIQDPAAVEGWSASNALRAQSP